MAGYLTKPNAGLFCGNVDFVGLYRITGTVDELGACGSYKVRLFLKNSGALINQVWSAADGTYAFNNIAYLDQGYFLVAHDHTTPKVNAAISDFVTPEPMP